jgi:hypothetical protein
LGVLPVKLYEPGVEVVAHAGLRDYAGAWFFVRGASAIVSTPPAWIDRVRSALVGVEAEQLLVHEVARRPFGASVDLVVGPAFQGWLPPARFRPTATAAEVRLVTAADREAVAALRAECATAEWEHSGIDLGAPDLWGVFNGGELTSLAQARRRAPRAVDPCAITRPSARRSGCAAHAVSAAIGDALASGTVVLFQTLLDNRPALALARRLGFEPYATSLAVRLAVGDRD